MGGGMMQKRKTYSIFVFLVCVSFFFGIVSVVATNVSIRIRPSSLRLEIGESETLETVIRPTDYEEEEISWRSSNSNVVSVDDDGTVYAKKAGTATITARMEESRKTAKVKVTVKAIMATKVTMLSDDLSLMVGEKVQVAASVEPENVSKSGVKWSSSNFKIATVSTNGTITAKKAGTTTIRATSKDGKRNDRIKVTIEEVPLEGIAFEQGERTLRKGKSVTLKVKAFPSLADPGKLTYKSSNTQVASVNSSGKVTAKKGGVATITATSRKGFSATMTIYVEDIAVEGVTLNQTDITLEIDDTYLFRATVLPSNALNKDVTWRSSNSSVASVSSSGRVVAKKAGTARITVTTKDGKKKATATVKVNKASIDDIYFKEDEIRLEEGDSYQLKAHTSPSSVESKDILWSSDNSRVVSVSSSGKLKAKKDGSALITAKVKGTNLKTTIEVIVKDEGAPQLSIDSLALDIGEAETVLVESPIDASVKWSSSNSKVATVNSRGKIVGKKAGKATITAKLKNGKKARVFVEVRNRKTSNPEPTDVYYVMVVGDIEALTIPGETIDYNNSEFESKDEDIIEIDERGFMTAVGTGETEVTITNSRGRKRTVYIYVREIAVSRVKVAESSITLYEGEQEKIDAWVEPMDASNQNLIWQSSKESVASVDDDGTIYANAKGSATIRVYSHDRKKKATVRVRVKES